MPNNAIKPRAGRERIRRNYVVDVEHATKFSQIAKLSGVSASDLLQQIMAQTVTEWERIHGAIKTGTTDGVSVDLSAAIAGAKATPQLKRGNPHPTGRKPKNPKQ